MMNAVQRRLSPRRLFAAIGRLVVFAALLPVVSSAIGQEIDAPDGFRVDKLYEAPREFGSWVAMTFDPQGRLIVSHESGGLYRVTLSSDDSSRVQVEPLDVDVKGAQGLLYAFGSLYAVAGGVVRIRDTDGDDQFDSVERLLTIEGRGEHGPHAIVLGPKKRCLYVIAGNATKVPPGMTRDRIRWAKDERPDPQGWVMRLDRDGENRELVAVGLRNSYGLALHPNGELFTFDSDNEGFMGLPWYRPTNIYHIRSGADFGWRQGPETRQSYHPDAAPPVVEVGPGSPTGMVFGTGARFPAKYQRALFAADWSYGRIYAVHLRPRGASFVAEPEFFLSGRPLAVTDIRIGPDGAMYFLTGGRGTQTSLYRVTAEQPSQPLELAAQENRTLRLRRRLESFHGSPNDMTVSECWPHLNHLDRAVRYAARIAIENQNPRAWLDRAFTETKTQARLEAMLAVARQTDHGLRPRILRQLAEFEWAELEPLQQLVLLRIYEIVFQRMGKPSGRRLEIVRERLDALYPHPDAAVNRELIKLLVRLEAKNLLPRTLTVLERTSSAMEQIHLLLQLGNAKESPTEPQRKRLMAALDLEGIRDTGARKYKEVAGLIGSVLKDIGAPENSTQEPAAIVNEWTLDELLESIGDQSLASADVNQGRAVFRKANCHRCHRIGDSGGVLGPNLTGLAGRFKRRDVLEAIVEPDKVIADQYRTTIFIKKDGTQFSGQIVNLSRGAIQIRLDPARPFPRVSFPEKDIEEMRLSNVSLMPKGTLNTLTLDEIRNLLAFLLTAR